MRKEMKQEVVARLEELLREQRHFIISGYRGLTVKEMMELRRAIGKVGGQLRVVKKSLFRRALGEGEKSGLDQYMEGPVAVTYVSDDALAVLKEMQAFARTHAALDFKGGWVDDELLDGEQVAALASLPPREELLAMLLASLSGPLTQLVGVLQAVPRDLALTLQAVAQQREGQPEAAASA